MAKASGAMACRNSLSWKTRIRTAILAGLAIFLLLGLASCGGGGGDSGGPTGSGDYVEFDYPTANNTTYSTTDAQVDIGGTYSSTGDVTGTVTWTNALNNTSGTAAQYQVPCNWFPPPCHTNEWGARVGLALGTNLITVRVTDPNGGYGSASITVKRSPSSVFPTVASTFPANGATGVNTYTALAATFSEPLDPSSVSASTFLLNDQGSTPVVGSVAYHSGIATFLPSSPLAPYTGYVATLTTGMRSGASNNPLTANYAWSFTTGPASPPMTPSVVATTPVNGGQCFVSGDTVSVTFNELMDTTTLDQSAFRLQGPNGQVSVLVIPTVAGAKLALLAVLANGTPYTATVSGQVKDLRGASMGADFVWSFSTCP
jgi:hypothetical protein